MAQAQNNSLVKITETINNIIAELDAFSDNVKIDNVKTEYTLAGSVAVYLFVYSLYVNERDAEKKESIKTQLQKLPTPNDIDIIIYTRGHLPKETLSAYKKKNPKNGNNTIPALNSVDGLPIIRRVTPIFKIDLIIINLNEPKKAVGDSISITFIHNGVEKKFNIVHPQNLISLYKNDDNRTDNQKVSNSIKRSVLKDLNKMKLLPEKEKPVSRYARVASMRGLSFGNGNSPSSATKRKMRNSGNLLPHSPPKTKKPSVKRSFSFGSNSP